MPIDSNQPASAGNGADAPDAQAKAQEVAGQAQEKAQAAAGQAQARLRAQLDQRSSQMAEQINEQGSDLRSVSQALREQGKEGPAKAADRMAEYAEKVGGYLRDRNSEALLQDAEDFGRRQPAAVAAGGLLLGFVASRFLKASSRERHSSPRTGQLPPPAPTRPIESLGGSSAPPPGAVSTPRGAVPPPPATVPPVRPVV